MKKSLGYQTSIDLYGCETNKINSCEFIEKTLLRAAEIMNLTVVNSTIHSFSPIGISGVVIIEESHIAIHTWPEYNYVAIDFFTCNQSYDLEEGISWLKNAFSAKKLEQTDGRRGNLDLIKKFAL